MGQAKRRQKIIERLKHLEEQRRFLEDIKRSHEKMKPTEKMPVSETHSNTLFDWFKIQKHTPPMRSGVMYKIKKLQNKQP